MTTNAFATAPVRAVSLGACRASLTRRGDGSIIVENRRPLGPYSARITDRLDHWARVAPDRVWLADRGENGEWRRVTYAQGRASVRRLAAALLARKLSADRPLVILSGNDIEHALLGTAALYAGIAYAPITPAYSLVSTDHSKLRHVFDLLTPGLVFVADAAPFARAIEAAVPPSLDIVCVRNAPQSRTTTAFAALAATSDHDGVDAAHADVGPETIAKFLFTSGSTGLPKAVINTQRMLCANAQMITEHFAYLAETPPVLLDWSPWNHTSGGNHNFNIVLHNGGTLHIDDGKPIPGAIEKTVRNIRDVSPTWYFNVPKGYDALLPHLRADPELGRRFFRDLAMMWYAGAGMAQHVWDGLQEQATAATGERVLMLTGLGATETAPFALAADQTMVGAGVVGIPGRGCTLKLVPDGEKLEARLKGPNITPGYWRQPDLTAAAFDDEGFYRLGDALRFVDPDDVDRGFLFDGRIAEDFKLATGTWAAVGPLRARIVDHFAPLIQDCVITGHDRDFLGALMIPDLAACRAFADDMGLSLRQIAGHPVVAAELRRRLATLARSSTGSSTRIARALLIDRAPSIDRNEVTDKGSINQRAVLANRADAVARIYAVAPDAGVLVA